MDLAIAPTLLYDIALMIIFATFLAYVGRILKQPLIPMYIIAGLILGPAVFGFIKNQAVIYTLSEIGIAFMLFIVGLEMNFKKLKEVGLVSSLGGFVQVLVTFVLGFLAGYLLGFGVLINVYFGLIVAFSSTMVVIKYLSDEEELHTLHGRIILGILLMQDILVVIALSLLTSVGNGNGFQSVMFAILKGLGLFAIALLLTKGFLQGIFKLAAKSQELLFLCSITFCFLFSALAVYIGFSMVVGAFIAGISLAVLPYNLDIIGRVKPLKDFFATLFFVSLGMQLIFGDFLNIILPLVLLFIVVVILKPVIIMVICSVFNYGKRTSFLSSISLAQISEFALVIAALGISLGHLSSEIFSLVVLLAGVTLGLTAYFIKYDNKIYEIFSKPLVVFEKLSLFKRKRLGSSLKRKNFDAVMFGCHRMGNIFLRMFKRMKKKILVVDYNPDIINTLVKNKINCLYGDIVNEEILHEAKLGKAKIVLSTIPDFEDTVVLVNYVKKVNKKALVFVTANHLGEALDLYKEGADYVILPHIFTAEGLSNLFKKTIRSKNFLRKIRKKHLDHLLELEFYTGKKRSLIEDLKRM